MMENAQEYNINVAKTALEMYFLGLEFDEPTHTYKKDDNILPSVSSLIKKYYKEFPLEEAAIAYGNKHDIDPEKVKEMWEENKNEALENGTKVHEYGEALFNSIEEATDTGSVDSYIMLPGSCQEHSILRYAVDHFVYNSNYRVLKTEKRMFSKKYDYAGTADLLYWDYNENAVVIADFKTNKDLYKNYGDNMLGQFDQLVDCSLSHYILQLSFYQIMLEEAGIPVCRREIIWLDRDTCGYEIIQVEDVSEQLRADLNIERGSGTWRDD